MDLSAVIVNWNTRDLLRPCLVSMREALAELETQGMTGELIVVDNASGDGSAAMVAAEFPDARLVANARNLNYAAASNQALALAQGEYVLLLNPDTEVPAGVLPQLLRFLEGDPEAGGVAPRLVHPGGGVQDSVRAFPTPPALLGEVTGLGRLFPRSRWGEYRRQPAGTLPALVDQPMASCLLLRRAALAEVGGFDEQFPLFFNDVDLSLRLRRAGWGIWFDPRVSVTHHGGASTRQVRPKVVWASHVGLLRFYRKHYRDRLPRPVYWAAVGAIVVAGAARVALAWLRNRLRPRREDHRAS